jgi:hypothetical protein
MSAALRSWPHKGHFVLEKTDINRDFWFIGNTVVLVTSRLLSPIRSPLVVGVSSSSTPYRLSAQHLRLTPPQASPNIQTRMRRITAVHAIHTRSFSLPDTVSTSVERTSRPRKLPSPQDRVKVGQVNILLFLYRAMLIYAWVQTILGSPV